MSGTVFTQTKIGPGFLETSSASLSKSLARFGQGIGDTGQVRCFAPYRSRFDILITDAYKTNHIVCVTKPKIRSN